jgi:hypothetical protein
MGRMKNRHAAALALVGWYLLAPPLMDPDEAHEQTALMAPLAHWFPYDEFDSVSECHKREAYFQTVAARQLAKSYDEKDRAAAFRARNVQCIATDDPRLKEK